MTEQLKLNRRKFVTTLAQSSFGVAIAGISVVGFGQDLALRSHIRSVIIQHFPSVLENPKVVDDFSQKLTQPDWKGLETNQYLVDKFVQRNFAELDRLIIMEFGLAGHI